MIVPLIFWGAVTVSLILTAIGLAVRSRLVLFGATVWALPLTFYLAGSPRFAVLAVLLFALQLVAAFVVRRWFLLAALSGSAAGCIMLCFGVFALSNWRNAAV